MGGAEALRAPGGAEALRAPGVEMPCMNERQAPLILIVDDDATIRLMLSHILLQVGLRSACAADGAEGVAQALALRPDLFLLDVDLPDTDGFSLCRQLQSHAAIAYAPVLFISANEHVSFKVRGFEAGGVDYITKPFSALEVVARVRTHLRLKDAYDTLARLQGEKIERLGATQQMIMPVPSSLPDARFAASLKQAHGAGGDFYDVIPVADGLVDYVVADGSGHDLETAFWTMAMKALLHEYASPLNTPADILRGINRTLCQILPEGFYFTVVYARLNRHSGTLMITSGGHPPAICLQEGQPCDILRQTGDLVGIFPDAGYDTVQRVLHRHDRFFLYTDGLVEAEGCREAGITALAGLCEQQRELALSAQVDAITADILARTDVADDVVLLGVEV